VGVQEALFKAHLCVTLQLWLTTEAIRCATEESWPVHGKNWTTGFMWPGPQMFPRSRWTKANIHFFEFQIICERLKRCIWFGYNVRRGLCEHSVLEWNNWYNWYVPTILCEME
jgi:hypothetical protein